jgi:type VI secretion system lysozyme-like protein
MAGALKAPLFSRLESPERVDQSLEALTESVRAEVETILNTRLSVTQDALDAARRTVVNFGIPDLPHFSGQSFGTWHELCDCLAATISAYEPRLTAVQVRSVVAEPDGSKLTLEVVADFRHRPSERPVLFTIDLP